MVNEALHLHLRTMFEKQGASPDDLRLVTQLCYDLSSNSDYSAIADRVVAAIDAVRVLDPACGSGAFPIGMLHRMVELLERVDPDNERWKARLLARLPNEMRSDAARGMEGKTYNYLRKLGLVQKNLYGLDIQPLAAVISKLRFFLTLVIEQEVDLSAAESNYGLQALPNLETNLLCCDTLRDSDHALLSGPMLADLRRARYEYYQPASSRERRDELARDIGTKLATLFPGFAQQTKGIVPANPQQRYEQDAAWLTEWFEHATVAAPFFDLETFFPELVSGSSSTLSGEFEFLRDRGGQTELTPQPQRNLSPFHIVIGNPPYGGNKISDDVRNRFGLESKDPYGAFIGRFLSGPNRDTPLAPDGVLSYIVSDTFMTIKTHRPLREQILANRIHKMIRVASDTFRATVNCAITLTQRGAAAENHICQMADLTNVSIHDQYERFLHVLYQTEGFGRRQNIANQTYAIYHYRQTCIPHKLKRPFLRGVTRKLFALMRDVGNKTRIEERDLPNVAFDVSLNGHALSVFKLGDQYSGMGQTRRWLNQGFFKITSGIETVATNVLSARLNRRRKTFRTKLPLTFFPTRKLVSLMRRKSVTEFPGDRHFVWFEMGLPSDADARLLPVYGQPPPRLALDWSVSAVGGCVGEPSL